MFRHHLLVLLLLTPAHDVWGDGLAAIPVGSHRRQLHSSAAVASAARRRVAPLLAAAASPDDAPRAPASTSASASASPSSSPIVRWLVANRSMLLLVCLVAHKCATDGLTRYTRVSGAYSGSTVAVMSEVVKFPLIATAIATFGGGPRLVLPAFTEALTRRPTANAWISLCYTFNNLLYFDALSALSATAYQVVSQSKTLFTAGLMYFLVGKRLLIRQLVAIAMLIGGALLVQLQELSRAGAGAAALGAAGASASAIYWGMALTLFSSFISALPNVAYERVLKTEGENQWVNNIQVTVWIMLWIAAANAAPPFFAALASLGGGGAAAPSLPSAAAVGAAIVGAPAAVRASFAGFTPAVWGVVLLKALNGILIPATFKYADNIVYSYAKPSSIVVTTILSCVLAGTLPSLSLLLGVTVVVGSIFLYSSKPKDK